MTHYVIRGGVEGKRRLEVLARIVWPTTARLLELAGVAPGLRCLDLGCGGGDVALELARLVGPGGHVTGIDMDETKLALARADAAQRGLGNVDFVAADVSTWGEESRYDLVYSRFLLTHLPDPSDVLRRIWRALRPGGRAAVEDIDMSGSFCDPPSAAYDRYVELYRTCVKRRGADPDVGRKLHRLARAAGWSGEIELGVVQPAFARGEGKRMAELTLQNVAGALLEEGLVGAEELRALEAELGALTAAADTVLSLPRIVQIRATRLD